MSASSLSCLPFVLLLVLRPPSATLTDTLLPYTTLFRSVRLFCRVVDLLDRRHPVAAGPGPVRNAVRPAGRGADPDGLDQPAGARHLGRDDRCASRVCIADAGGGRFHLRAAVRDDLSDAAAVRPGAGVGDRKSTRLNSSH